MDLRLRLAPGLAMGRLLLLGVGHPCLACGGSGIDRLVVRGPRLG